MMEIAAVNKDGPAIIKIYETDWSSANHISHGVN
jgi:hypothetical protein